MPEKIASVVIKLVPEAEEKTNAELEKEIFEAVKALTTGFLPYQKQVLMVAVRDLPTERGR